MAFRIIVTVSGNPERRKNLCWLYQTRNNKAKQIAKAPKPLIAWASSLKVLGTSRDTTSRVIANPNTASLNPSMPKISSLRQRNFPAAPTRFSISFSRIIFTGSGDSQLEVQSPKSKVESPRHSNPQSATFDLRLWTFDFGLLSQQF